MAKIQLLVALSLFNVCLCSLPVSPFGKVTQPKLVWSIFSERKDDDDNSETLARKVRAVDSTEPTVGRSDKFENDIYWKPWNQRIPDDAVIGGFRDSDCGKTPIFMAQVYKSMYDSALIPAQIFSKSKAVTVSYAGSQSWHKKDIKILCAQDPEILTWVSNKHAKEFNITAEEDCVIGGTEQQQKTHVYFGRTTYDEEVIIGKVLYHTDKMYFPYDGEEVGVNEYEMLCYTTAIENRMVEALRKKQEKRMEVKQSGSDKET